MRKIKKKYGYEEMNFNSSLLKRAYHTYLHQSVFDKILDVLVLFAICFTIFEVIAQFLFDLSPIFLKIVHSLSVFILTIFGLELLREYALSNHYKDFFRKQWLDFILVVFLSFYFFTGTYLGLAKFEKLTKLKNLAFNTKNYKVILTACGFRKL